MVLPALIALVLSQSPPPPWLTGLSRPEDLDISLVTFGPGDTLTEWWGHTALDVQDRRLHHGRLYNYGEFAFDDGFAARFVRGRLEFWVGEDAVMPTFQFYKSSLNRDVRIQELNLTPAQAMQVAQALATNVLPQNRMYLYDHYKDNCSTRPRDIVDAALGGQLSQATQGPARMSLRRLTRKYDRVNPPMSLILDYMQNNRLDGPILQRDEAFLPDELERQLQQLQVKREDGSVVPAVKRQWNWFKSNRAPLPDQPPQWIPLLFLMGSAFTGLAFLLWRGARAGRRLARVALGIQVALLSLAWGVLGTALALVGTFTNNLVTHHNENLFFANPVTLAGLPAAVMFAVGSPRGRRALFRIWTVLGAASVLGVAVKVLPWFDQDNWNIIALMLPVDLGLAVLFWLDHRRGPSGG